MTGSERKTANLKPFKKGQSGNPNGRKPQALSTVEKLRTALASDAAAILKVVVENAKKGDIGAAKVILERVLPPLKAIEPPVLLEQHTGTLSEQGQAILAAMANGVLAPGQAAQLLGAIAAQAKIVEVDELTRRLTELERRLGATSGNG